MSEPELTLEQEVVQLREWKESAIRQFQKAEKLHEFLREHGMYLGWDMYEAALDLLKKGCPCCGYPKCGHTHGQHRPVE